MKWKCREVYISGLRVPKERFAVDGKTRTQCPSATRCTAAGGAFLTRQRRRDSRSLFGTLRVLCVCPSRVCGGISLHIFYWVRTTATTLALQTEPSRSHCTHTHGWHWTLASSSCGRVRRDRQPDTSLTRDAAMINSKQLRSLVRCVLCTRYEAPALAAISVNE